ncbi:LysR family transcriptional regulator [Alkalilimnicola ehrlichii]|uniref:LysR family transcriptional regulator n=1 Tax=Alkalilimnicola ehrlichii TaxID=351052 RepID=UPI0015F28E58|nr:LysR family transcriptional regulator [Alkalilimnicola ehrlichii]
MDKLRCMHIFTRVAELGSFTKTAEEIGISTAQASRAVAELENHVGVRLFNRSTRKISPTEAGQRYLGRCRAILEEIDDTEATLGADAHAPAGRVRVHTPVSFGLHCLSPYLPAFAAQYPQVSVDLTLSEQAPEVVEGIYDIVVLGAREGFDSGITARKLFSCEVVLCATPAFVERYGSPKRPPELADYPLIDVSHEVARGPWQLTGPDGSWDVRPLRQGQITSNNAELLYRLAMRDAGIAPLPEYIVGADLQAGRLIRILPQWKLQTLDFFAALPSRRFLPLKVRVFLEFLRQTLKDSLPALR